MTCTKHYIIGQGEARVACMEHSIMANSVFHRQRLRHDCLMGEFHHKLTGARVSRIALNSDRISICGVNRYVSYNKTQLW